MGVSRRFVIKPSHCAALKRTVGNEMGTYNLKIGSGKGRGGKRREEERGGGKRRGEEGGEGRRGGMKCGRLGWVGWRC